MRVAVLSDIHANLVALDAVLAAVGSVDAVWQLGDVVGYGPEPDAVVERLQAIGAVGVGGQPRPGGARRPRDRLVQPGRQGSDGVDPGDGSATRRGPGSRACPTTRREGDMTLVHGSPRDPVWEYITSIPVARANLADLETPIGLHGHTHVPMAWADRDGRVEAIAPGPGSTFQLDGRCRALSTRAASASRVTATRPPAGWRSTPTPPRRPGGGSPTTSSRSGPRCSTPGLPGRLAERLRAGL